MQLDSIKQNIHLVKEKTATLLVNFPAKKSLETPAILNTNLNWQIGHIILANSLHGVASISGPNSKIKDQFSIEDYIKFYGPKSNPLAFTNEKPSFETLMENYEFVYTTINKAITPLNENDLTTNTAIPNPSVKTKAEALNWLVQHQSWHNGQIAILKRILNADN